MEYHRFDWVCGGIQKLTEDMLTTWIRNAVTETGVRKVVLSGGVFMNVKANKAIMELPEVEALFIFPSCGDETNAIGAAWHLYSEVKKQKGERIDIQPLEHFYLGSEFNEGEIDEAIKGYHFEKKVNIKECNDIEKVVAELIAKGEVVARFKGRMEFGARSLGNRSILANPSEWKVIKIINDMIKNRDFWMPFAPSMLGDRSHEYVVNPKGIKAPYMILTFDTKQEKVNKLIAAIHPYDSTCRPQEVYKDWNEGYYKLISYYSCLTGESTILNTSFNLHGYPIVCTPEDALEVFNRSGLTYLALENMLLKAE
jgi:carbamoyltransferase